MDSKNHYIMFLDESGTHNYEDRESTIFGLCGVIFRSDYYHGEVEGRFNGFKREVFGTSDIILHYADYVRNRNGFERMAVPEFRHKFYRNLGQLLKELEFKIIVCRLNKPWHWKQYGLMAHDPYHYALRCLVERFVLHLSHLGGTGTIIAESRTEESGSNSLDSVLDIAFLRLKVEGSHFVKPATIRERITGNLLIRKKRENIAGLQIADSIVTPIVRRKTKSLAALEKQEREENALDFRIVEGKFRKGLSGAYRGYGLVDLPRA